MAKIKFTRSRLIDSLIFVFMFVGIFTWLNCDKEPQQMLAQSQISQPQASPAQVSSDIGQVMAIQNRHTESLLAVADVIGTATGILPYGNYAVKILTKKAGMEKILPKSLEGIPVVVENIGEVRALQVYTGRYRPVPGGVTGGNINDRKKRGIYINCSVGTIGSVLIKGGVKYLLSNNHVFARENKASIGEDIVQPGLNDVSCNQISNDVVADLSQFKSLVFKTNANNTIDAAIAQVRTSPPDIGPDCAMICGYTPGTTPVSATLNLPVKKCGRTTGLTTGTVTGLNVTVIVSYNSGKARFVNQIQFSNLSDRGDSGSLIVTQSGNKPVALLFAGSDTSTIGNPIQEVLNYFGATICGQ